MRIGKLLNIVTIGAMQVAFSSHLTQSQTVSDLLNRNGIEQLGSYHGGDIDVVDLGSGRPVINIPLVAYPQRGGKLQLNYVLQYHNSGAVLGGLKGCVPTIGGSCIVFPYDSGFKIVETGLSDGHGICEFGGPGAGSECSGLVTEGSGASHMMMPIGPTTFRAMDGSGYRLDVPPGWPAISGGASPNSSHYVTDGNGTRYSYGPNLYPVISEDTNGNEITFSGSNWTDTLGRTVPNWGSFPVELTYWPSGIGTTDFSRCSGPLPIVGAVLWSPPGPNGGSYPLKFCFVAVSEKMPPDQNFVQPYYMTTANQVQSVVLPNGLTWTFEYEGGGSGNLSRITLPFGGTISYTWINLDSSGNVAQIPFAIASRTLNPNSNSPSEVWQYHYSPNFPARPALTTVTDPAGNDTVHGFTWVANGNSGSRPIETSITFYQGAAGGNVILKTVNTDLQIVGASWTPNLGAFAQTALPIRSTTIWANGQQTKVEHDYDSGFTVQVGSYDVNGNWTLSCNTCGGGFMEWP